MYEEEEEGLFGPGTDLVVSLSALLLVLLLTAISYYADAIEVTKLFDSIAIDATEKKEMTQRQQRNLERENAEIRKSYTDAIERTQILEAKLDRLRTQHESLETENRALEAKYRNTLIPRRSPIGKHIVVVKFDKIGELVRFYVSEIDDSTLKNVTRAEMHQRLRKLQDEFGGALYVRILENPTMIHGEFMMLTQEVLQYDYYQLTRPSVSSGEDF